MLLIVIIGGVLLLLVIFAYVTNPFTRFSTIRRPYRVHSNGSKWTAQDDLHKLTVRNAWLWRKLAIMKCGIHILETRYAKSPTARSRTVEGIIKDIHRHRFRPERLLLTSGDHFNGLFVRNLGVFYYPMLDTAIAGSEEDWQRRQAVYLQTAAYALGIFRLSPVPTTTIVSTGRYQATCVNFYAYPSDTVYGILYALAALTGHESARPSGERTGVQQHRLQTKKLAEELLAAHKETLAKLYEHYRHIVFDDQTGLIRTELHLSGAKDITRRRSAFYDNVIFWKTTQLAAELGIIPPDETFLQMLKKRILKTFWLEEQGYFLEDLSPESRERAYYSSDWLIVLATGFLRLADPAERAYYRRSIAYIQQQGIDKPFALRYHQDVRAHRQFFAVRLAVASYGGSAIWSFWGMEYCKALLLLHKYTHNDAYAQAAAFHIAAYEKAMLRDHGFPEVYDDKGRLLQTPLYRSIRQTGWVIGFEQVRTMQAALQRKTRG